MSITLKKAIKSLQDNANIMIRKADKGGAVVVLDTELYCLQVPKILNDQDTYRVLESDPTAIFSAKLDHPFTGGCKHCHIFL